MKSYFQKVGMSPGTLISSTNYNWLVMIKPMYGGRSNNNRNSLPLFPTKNIADRIEPILLELVHQINVHRCSVNMIVVYFLDSKSFFKFLLETFFLIFMSFMKVFDNKRCSIFGVVQIDRFY